MNRTSRRDRLTSRTQAARVVVLVAAIAATLAWWGCSSAEADGTSLGTGVAVFDAYDYHTPPDLVRGKAMYLRHCSGCHGPEGDGKGPAAEWLNPKPRNFQAALYKFSSTPSGQLPTEEDLMHTLVHGVSGTSMPEWELLPWSDRRGIIAYLKTFAEARWSDTDRASPIPMGDDPYRDDAVVGILEGELVYHAVATCWNCHPAYISEETMRELYGERSLTAPSGFRDDLFHSILTTSSEGERVIPPDFTWDKIKTAAGAPGQGADLKEIYLRIAAGITGTAMPTWSGSLPEADLWAMAYYVKHLADEYRTFPRDPADRVPFADRYPKGLYPILIPEEAE